jgi:hypothetical protein
MGSCSGLSGAGEAAIIIVVVVVVAFAVFGLFVAVVAGTGFAQRVTQRHMHVLHKRQLAHDFVVSDLESQDGGVLAERRRLGVNDDGSLGGGAGACTDGHLANAGETMQRYNRDGHGYQGLDQHNPLMEDEGDVELGSITIRAPIDSPEPSAPPSSLSLPSWIRPGVNNPTPTTAVLVAPVMSEYQYRELARMGLV